MVLYGVLVSSVARRALSEGSREPRYDFEMETRGASKRGEPMRLPKQFFLLGFKDSRLEAEYMNDLVVVEKKSIVIGYLLCCALVALGIFTYDTAGINSTATDVLQNPDSKRDYGHSTRDTFLAMLDVVVTLGSLLLGFAATLVIYRFDRFDKEWIVLIAETVYLIFIVFMGWDMAKLSTGRDELAFPVGGWVYQLAFFYLPPFIVVFFMALPFAQTLLIVTLAVLTFFVIVPLTKGLYDQLSESYLQGEPIPPPTHTHTKRRTDCLLPLSTEEHFDQSPILNEVCNASALNYAACYESTVLRLSLSITVLLIIALGIIVVSKYR